MIRAKSCVVCGRRTPDGAARCPLHKVGSGRPRPCLVCGRPSQGNFCQMHEPTVDEQIRNDRNPYRRAYKDPQYARNRQHAFERAHGRCQRCNIVLQPGMWQCDHIVSLSRGGTNDVTNLAILCVSCHKSKTSQDRRK